MPKLFAFVNYKSFVNKNRNLILQTYPVKINK